MGNKITQETLYEAIEASRYKEAQEIIKANPLWINQQMIKDSKTTPLGLASWNGDMEMMYILIENGADINQYGHRGMTPLHWACKNGNEQAVDYLLQKGADPKLESEKENLNAFDWAFAMIQYNTARKLHAIGVKPKPLEIYYGFAERNLHAYYNYEKLLDHIERKIPFEECPSFLEERPTKKYYDPVIDPRETWSQFFKRVSEFQDPPLVERSELPPELQPQNRGLGKLMKYFSKEDQQPPVQSPEENPEESRRLTPRKGQQKEIELGEEEVKQQGEEEIPASKKDFVQNEQSKSKVIDAEPVQIVIKDKGTMVDDEQEQEEQ